LARLELLSAAIGSRMSAALQMALPLQWM
jgi:hypothetical protein